MTEYEKYKERIRLRAIDLVMEHITGWTAEDAAEAAPLLMERGFVSLGGLGATGRVVANTLRKVRPIPSFDEAKNLTSALYTANRELAATFKLTDDLPYVCSHCGGRFREWLSPRVHYTQHRTVFDPRDL